MMAIFSFSVVLLLMEIILMNKFNLEWKIVFSSELFRFYKVHKFVRPRCILIQFRCIMKLSALCNNSMTMVWYFSLYLIFGWNCRKQKKLHRKYTYKMKLKHTKTTGKKSHTHNRWKVKISSIYCRKWRLDAATWRLRKHDY